jgi:hypothetical protein
VAAEPPSTQNPEPKTLLDVVVEMKLVAFRELRELQDVVCAEFANYDVWPRGW